MNTQELQGGKCDEEHLRQVIWKDVAKVVEGVEDFFGTNENLQLILAKLDEFTPK